MKDAKARKLTAKLANDLGTPVDLAATMIAVTSGTPSSADVFNYVESDDSAYRKLTYDQLLTALRTAIFGLPAQVSGRNYFLDHQGFPSNGSNIGTAKTRCFPVRIQQPVTIDRLGCHIATASAGGNLRLALYNHDNTNKRPSTLVAGTGNIATDSTGTVIASLVDSAGAAVSSVTINPGMYWGTLRVDNATVITTGYGASAAYGTVVGDAGGTALIGSSAVGSKSLDYTTGYSFAGNFSDLSATAADTIGFSNNNALLIGRVA